MTKKTMLLLLLAGFVSTGFSVTLEETGDAVIVFEDGSARFMRVFSSPEGLYTYARSLQQELKH